MELLFHFHVWSAYPSVSMGKVWAVWDLRLTSYHFLHNLVDRSVRSQCMLITGRFKSDKSVMFRFEVWDDVKYEARQSYKVRKQIDENSWTYLAAEDPGTASNFYFLSASVRHNHEKHNKYLVPPEMSALTELTDESILKLWQAGGSLRGSGGLGWVAGPPAINWYYPATSDMSLTHSILLLYRPPHIPGITIRKGNLFSF